MAMPASPTSTKSGASPVACSNGVTTTLPFVRMTSRCRRDQIHRILTNALVVNRSPAVIDPHVVSNIGETRPTAGGEGTLVLGATRVNPGKRTIEAFDLVDQNDGRVVRTM